MRYYLESLGCAKNLVDSEHFVHILKSYGFSEAVYLEDADVVLVNTCAFLAASLGELDEVLSEIIDSINPKKTRVVVTGCVMNRALAEFQELFPEVNKWIALKDFAAFEKYLLRYVLPKGIKPRVVDLEGREMLDQDGLFAYLRISDGCENYCSYCMIPSIRGKLVSEPIEKLVEEARRLAPRGRELVLIAQDSCLYGTDLYGRKALPELIEKLHEIPGYDWIRIMYMHPDHFEPEWTSLWHRFPKLLPYFEIPIQHVSDRIIKQMNRQKSYQELKELFLHIRREIPQSVFRTTLMLGYPTESKADRDMILKFLDEVDILYVGVFGYSPEKEMQSESGVGDFDFAFVEQLKNEFEASFLELRERKMQAMVGTRHQFLVEGYAEEMNSWYGRLWFQAPDVDGIAYVDGLQPDNPVLTEVEIVDALADELSCQAITDADT